MRRDFFPQPNFQVPFIRAFVISAAGIVALLGVCGLTSLYFLSNSPMLSPSQKLIIDTEIKTFFWALMLMVIFVSMVFALIGFYFSHRFIGPLIRLEGWVRHFIQKSLNQPLKVRPKDDLVDMVASINQITKSKADLSMN